MLRVRQAMQARLESPVMDTRARQTVLVVTETIRKCFASIEPAERNANEKQTFSFKR